MDQICVQSGYLDLGPPRPQPLADPVNGPAVAAVQGSCTLFRPCLAEFGQRVRVGALDVAATDWWPEMDGADAVISYPDPVDTPALFEQLCWMRDTGLASVDCFWLEAGHAIYGGYRDMSAAHPQLAFGAALSVATWSRSDQA